MHRGIPNFEPPIDRRDQGLIDYMGVNPVTAYLFTYVRDIAFMTRPCTGDVELSLLH